MRTVDERLVAADADRVFQAASDVERWPAILPHYRALLRGLRECRSEPHRQNTAKCQ